MSAVLMQELPAMLADEQMADACTVNYLSAENVFNFKKWRDLVSVAVRDGDLSLESGLLNIASVNDWLANCGVGLWSVFELHDPLLPDMEGLFEVGDYASLPSPIQDRIRRIFALSPWADLTPKERWEKVFAVDALNTPRKRLLFSLGNLVYWGSDEGPSLPTVHSVAQSELEQRKGAATPTASEMKLKSELVAEQTRWVVRLDAFKDKMLIGCLLEDDEIRGLVELLGDAALEDWCIAVAFPVWLDQFDADFAPADLSQQEHAQESIAYEPKAHIRYIADLQLEFESATYKSLLRHCIDRVMQVGSPFEIHHNELSLKGTAIPIAGGTFSNWLSDARGLIGRKKRSRFPAGNSGSLRELRA